MPSSSHNLAYTALVNPSDSTLDFINPHITASQLWDGLLAKARAAEGFVGGAILSTTVLDESTNEDGNLVINREVVFSATPDAKPVHEKVTAYEPSQVDFEQPNGSVISNVISEGSHGELYLTYVFRWMHPGLSAEEVDQVMEKEKSGAKTAVEATLVAVRKLVQEENAARKSAI
ncbi:DUF1857 domain-containing protein [Penicillium ucsense]|uniref:DUF1857 domain-containing protein n=1 Tax=Penicillium ucsense TaxID=2839758 RepID=A0A8J8W7V1_9EURO|nr:DUF1857 domain-containing protein [Penicillium ucsense]KAF7739129.1 DUF1857 domain-containing protein [Penicillium ucsense]